jgi:hypothetical protein
VLTVGGGERIEGQHGNWEVIADGREREKK